MNFVKVIISFQVLVLEACRRHICQREEIIESLVLVCRHTRQSNCCLHQQRFPVHKAPGGSGPLGEFGGDAKRLLQMVLDQDGGVMPAVRLWVLPPETFFRIGEGAAAVEVRCKGLVVSCTGIPCACGVLAIVKSSSKHEPAF